MAKKQKTAKGSKKKTTAAPTASGKGNKPHGEPKNLTPNLFGRSPITIENFPLKWDRFCAHYKCFASSEAAARYAGFHPDHGKNLLKLPVVQQRLATYDPMAIMLAMQQVLDDCDITEKVLDQNLMRVVNSGDHERRGLSDVVAAIRVGYEKINLITNPRIAIQQNNIASAGTATPGGTTAYEIHKAGWLIRKEAEMDRRLEAEFANQCKQLGDGNGAKQPTTIDAVP